MQGFRVYSRISQRDRPDRKAVFPPASILPCTTDLASGDSDQKVTMPGKTILYLSSLVLLIATCAQGSAHDVNNVLFRGDSTLMGMRVNSVYSTDGAFLVETTGARFEYTSGVLKIYQGLTERRLLASMAILSPARFEKAEATDDHVLFRSDDLNIGIYGDSTCIITPGADLTLAFNGSFKPDYEGRYNGELLLIDALGGMEIYPQRYETGYSVENIELGRRDWAVRYQVKAGNRVMIAAFPGKEFDWEASFKCNILFTYGSRGMGTGNAYGEMPPDDRVRKWADEGFNILAISYEGVYADIPRVPYPFPVGPYVVVNEPEFQRVVNAAHAAKMRFSVYASYYSHFTRWRDTEKYFNEVKALRDKFGIDGVYLDGMLSDCETNVKVENKIANWEMIRRLRQLFGPSGSIIYHGTSLGSKVAAVPNIDSYCTATLNGEGVTVTGPNDPYVRYQVRKYGISNTVAIWYYDKRPASFTYTDLVDAVLAMNGRMLAYGGVAVLAPPKDNKYVWYGGAHPEYRDYLKKLSTFRKAHSPRSKTE
jgi:hypothetical protein